MDGFYGGVRGGAHPPGVGEHLPRKYRHPPENVDTPQNLTEKSENSKKVRLRRAYS